MLYVGSKNQDNAMEGFKIRSRTLRSSNVVGEKCMDGRQVILNGSNSSVVAAWQCEVT